MLDTFTYYYDEMSPGRVQHEDLYDFLYENNYPIWFVEYSQKLLDARSLKLWIMRLHTGATISDLFPELQPAEVHELGQTYLQKLSEDILNYYAGEPDEVGLQQTECPAEVQNLQRRLELDGFTFRDARLLASDTNVLAEEEERGVLESLYQRLGLQNEKTAFHHLDLSEQHYLAGRWDDSIGNARKVLETVLREVAAAHSSQQHTSRLSENDYQRPVNVRNYLENEGVINKKEREALSKVYGLLSDTGGHPNVARNDQARLLRNLALTLAQFIMLRFQGSSGKT